MLKTGSCRSGRRLFLLLLACSCLAACTETINISLHGCLVQDSEETVGAVLPYWKDDAKRIERRLPGPFIAAFFSAPADLDALGSSNHVSHLQYNIIACASVGDEAYLVDGDVFRSSPIEVESLVGSGRSIGEHVYKVYIPRSLTQIGKRAEGYALLNVPEELGKVRSTGLCMIIGGGNMLGGGFWSQAVRVPVKAVGDSLEISLETEQSTSTPEPAKSPEE